MRLLLKILLIGSFRQTSINVKKNTKETDKFEVSLVNNIHKNVNYSDNSRQSEI